MRRKIRPDVCFVVFLEKIDTGLTLFLFDLNNIALTFHLQIFRRP